ncbi:hypothetical protein VaNZ11_005360 [Volvox africanus]|uniref:VASt domain-containing protein n=1 Tax=Volvox africanus TaxID=51714 RepID=A0ABQ5RYY1_9CHLO|nr:hypothetical protein VaNZ11_005360 [Volvox africanus]
MGRPAVPLDTIWPNGSDPKTLVCVRAQCSVVNLFNTVFGEPDLTEQLHKQRGDTELVETPWYLTKDALPQQLYTWQVSDPPNKPSATLRYRKVRFESPPTALAAKPFQNEESQVITELYPETLYVVEAVSSTSAPYGDKFNVYFRYIFRADDAPGSSVLHIVFHVEWLPAMNRMMRPVVGKAVDAGVRGTFRIFRTILGTKQPVADIRESELPKGGPPAVVSHEPTVEGEEVAAAPGAGPANTQPHTLPTAGFAPGVGPPPNILSVMSQQLMYKDQVVLLADLLGAGLRSVSASDLGAQMLAATLTIWLISLVVAALRGWQGLCSTGADVSGLMWLVLLAMCWPLALMDLPDSTAEVLTSLALVAAINWALIRGSGAVVRYLGKAHPGFLAAARGGGGDRGGGVAGGGGDVIGGVPFSQTPVLVTRKSSGGAPGGGGGGRGTDGGAVGMQSSSSPLSRSPSTATSSLPTASAASVTAAGGGGTTGKDQDKNRGGSASNATSFFTAAMEAATSIATKGAAPLGVSPAVASPKPKPMRAAPAPKQFTAAQLRQLELGHVTSLKKPPTPPQVAQTQPPVPAAAPVSSAVPAAAAVTDASAADLPAGVVAPSCTSATPGPRAPSPPPRSLSPPPKSGAATPAATTAGGGSGGATAEAGSDGTAISTRSASAAEPASAKQSEGSGGRSGQVEVTATPPMPTPSPATKVLTVPLAAAPLAPAAQPLAATAGSITSHAGGGPSSLTAGSTFANMFTREGIDSMAESLRSAFRWDTSKTADFSEVGSPESGSPRAVITNQIAKLKAHSEAGGVLASEAATAAGTGASMAARRLGGGGGGPTGQRSGGGGGGGGAHTFTLGVMPTSLSMFSVHSDVPLLAHGEEDEYGGGGDEGYDGEMEPALVVEEVFENERFQPFRGWGHMWPGHFLPSDRVGHWSDRQGKPGGSASMVFEQVVPQLPPGWRWLEDDWQVDLEGVDMEAVDNDGWTYALDFYLLKYPAPPQGGKCSMKHFVRRRRYYRTRVRAEDRSTRSSGEFAPPFPLSTRVSESGVDGEQAKKTQAEVSAAPPVATAAAAAAVTSGDSLELQDRLLSLSDGIVNTSKPDFGRPDLGHAARALGSEATSATGDGGSGGGGGGGAHAAIELRLPASTSASPSAITTGNLLWTPRFPAEETLEVSGAQPPPPPPQQQPQQAEGLRNSRSSVSGPAGDAVSTTAAPPPAKALLELFSGSSDSGSMEMSARTAAGGAATDTSRHGDGDADGTGGTGRGGGRGAAPHSGMFVLSPKTEMMSHDPLGALAAGAGLGSGGSPPPDFPAGAVLPTNPASKAAIDGGTGGPTSTNKDAVQLGVGPNPTPTPNLGQSEELCTEAAVDPASAAALAEAPFGVADAGGNFDSGPSASAVAASLTSSPDEVLAAATAPKELAEEVPTAATPVAAGDTGVGGIVSSAPVSAVVSAGPGLRESLLASGLTPSSGTGALSLRKPETAASGFLSEGLPEGPIIAADLVESS